MSAGAQQVSGLRVKYVRGDDRRREVDMFDAGDKTTNGSRREKQPRAVRRRCSPIALSVLHLLLLAAISTRYVFITLDRDELQNSCDQLKASLSALQANTSKLQSSFQTLREELSLSQLQERMLREASTAEHLCPERWVRSGCSCYMKSSEESSWFQGRIDCHMRGGHLVVINSPEEQEFVSKLSTNREFWIGLRAQSRLSEKTWKWVDGSSLTQMFVAWDRLMDPVNSSVVFCDPQGTWTQTDKDLRKTWICEKPISFCC